MDDVMKHELHLQKVSAFELINQQKIYTLTALIASPVIPGNSTLCSAEAPEMMEEKKKMYKNISTTFRSIERWIAKRIKFVIKYVANTFRDSWSEISSHFIFANIERTTSEIK